MCNYVLTSDDIRNLFTQYYSDMDAIAIAEQALFVPHPKEDWLAFYKQRSAAIRVAYDNSSALVETAAKLENGLIPLNEKLADTLYDELCSLDVTRYDDPFLFVRFIRALLDYYTKTNNLPRTLMLTNRLAWEYIQCARMGYHEAEKKAVECYRTVLSYKDRYSEFEDVNIRRLFFVAYYNLADCIPSIPGSDTLGIEESAEYLREATAFYNSAKVRTLDGSSDVIKGIYEFTRSQWLGCSDLYCCKALSPETLSLYCNTAKKVYDEMLKEKQGDIYAVGPEAVIAFRHALVIEGKSALRQEIVYLWEYYIERKRRNTGKTKSDHLELDDEFFCETRIPDVILTWLEDPSVPASFHDEYFEKIYTSKRSYFDSLNNYENSAFLNESIAVWSFDMLRYIDDQDEKEELIFNNIINRQISTFFHSHMVERLAGMFTDSVLRNAPELFISAMEAHNVAEVLSVPGYLREYVSKGALMHDIGKVMLTDIINRQTRKLTEEEYSVIRRHPDIGIKVIGDDFIYYHDIIRGHHRTYDCQAGYPSEYDTRGSRNKLIIDIISICDALDAATDYLGRNYSSRKSLSTVLTELQEGIGTRYNPFLVGLIVRDTTLYSEIETLLSSGREDLYYRLFSEFLLNK